jgi:hypothetical protein
MRHEFESRFKIQISHIIDMHHASIAVVSKLLCHYHKYIDQSFLLDKSTIF